MIYSSAQKRQRIVFTSSLGNEIFSHFLVCFFSAGIIFFLRSSTFIIIIIMSYTQSAPKMCFARICLSSRNNNEIPVRKHDRKKKLSFFKRFKALQIFFISEISRLFRRFVKWCIFLLKKKKKCQSSYF